MNKKTIIGAGSFAAAGIVAGCIMSITGVANASNLTPAAVSPSASSSVSAPVLGSAADTTSRPTFDAKGGPHGGTPVTGDLKTTLSDLALAKVDGATVDDVIQHADGTYDVHMTKADGTTHVSVEIDANQNITDVHEMTPPPAGFGPGRGHGPDGKGPDGGQANGGFTPPTTTATPAPTTPSGN